MDSFFQENQELILDTDIKKIEKPLLEMKSAFLLHWVFFTAQKWNYSLKAFKEQSTLFLQNADNCCHNSFAVKLQVVVDPVVVMSRETCNDISPPILPSSNYLWWLEEAYSIKDFGDKV